MEIVKFGEYIHLAFTEIFHNKVRTFLTLIGIIIGIAAVIVIIFVVQGAETYVMQELDSLIPLDLIQLTGRWDPESQRMLAFITDADLEYLDEEMGEMISAMAPQYSNSGELRYKDKVYDADLIATTPSFQEFYEMNMSKGRFLSELDIKDFNNVVVLGYETAKELFQDESAIGKKVNIYGVSFIVVGVLIEAYQSPMIPIATNDTRGFIPISSFERLYGVKNQYLVNIRAANIENVDATENRIMELLNQKHGLVEDGNSKFRSYNMSQGLDEITIIKIVLMVLLSGVASITLLVAGIGVMNIMLVIITERTKEIGLRKAIGATKRDILMQFIIESIVLCLLGGILGILLGYLGSNLVMDYARNFINIDIDVPTWAVIVSLLFTSTVGLFFGIYPAAKAARLDPIKALHYE